MSDETDDPLDPRAAEERMRLLQAAVDGELDAAAMLLFERRLEADPVLRANYDRLLLLRQAMRGLAKTKANEAFRARMAALVASQKPEPSGLAHWSPRFEDWQQTALAASLALMLGAGLTFLTLRPGPPDIAQDLIAAHVRGMIAGQPADVASTDRHTVKPWFSTRVTQAPQVVDLTDAGFPLAGGRIDVIGDRPVATLIYTRAKHVISVTELPPGTGQGQAEARRKVKGYSVLSWSEGPADAKTTYVAVSDVAQGDLDALAAAFKTATAGE